MLERTGMFEVSPRLVGMKEHSRFWIRGFRFPEDGRKDSDGILCVYMIFMCS